MSSPDTHPHGTNVFQDGDTQPLQPVVPQTQELPTLRGPDAAGQGVEGYQPDTARTADIAGGFYNHPGHHTARGRNESNSVGRRFALVGVALIGAIGAGAAIWGVGEQPDKQPGPGVSAGPVPGASAEAKPRKRTATEVTLPKEFDTSKERNLLADGNWQYTPGVRLEGGVLVVSKTGMKQRLEGPAWEGMSKYQENPAINVMGGRLQTNGGDFGIAMRVGGMTKEAPAVINLYSEPDWVYDERRYVQPKTQLSVRPDSITVRVWRGNGEQADETKALTFKADTRTGFYVKQEGEEVAVGAGKNQVRFAADMYKSSREMWFGFGAGSDFTVDTMAAYPAADGAKVEIIDNSKLQLSPLAADGLQKLVAARRPDLQVGAAITMAPLMRYGSVREKIGENYGLLVAETDTKPQAMLIGAPGKDGRVTKGDFDFSAPDAFVQFARRNNRQYKFHTLDFGEAQPPAVERMLQDVVDGKRPISDVDNYIDSYCRIIAERYADASAVDVVNEPLADTSIFDKETEPANKHLFWKAYETAGGDGRLHMKRWFDAYRKYARQFSARDAQPELLMNENGTETDEDRQSVLIGYAKFAGADGVGLQAHLDKSDISTQYDFDGSAEGNVRNVQEAWQRMLAKYARNGLRAQISELSMDEGDAHIQAVMGEGIMRAAIASKNITAIISWSPINGPFSFTSEPNADYDVEPGNDGPFDFDEDGQRVYTKESYDGLVRGAKGG